jgi:hypothetical protein
MFFEKPMERGSADAKLQRGLADVAPISIEHLDERVALGAVADVAQRGEAVLGDIRLQVKVDGLDQVPARQNHRSADLVL